MCLYRLRSYRVIFRSLRSLLSAVRSLQRFAPFRKRSTELAEGKTLEMSCTTYDDIITLVEHHGYRPIVIVNIAIGSWCQSFGGYGYEEMTSIVLGHFSSPISLNELLLSMSAQVMLFCPDLYYQSVLNKSRRLPLFRLPTNVVCILWWFVSFVLNSVNSHSFCVFRQ